MLALVGCSADADAPAPAAGVMTGTNSQVAGADGSNGGAGAAGAAGLGTTASAAGNGGTAGESGGAGASNIRGEAGAAAPSGGGGSGGGASAGSGPVVASPAADGYAKVSSYPVPPEAKRSASAPPATLDTFVHTSNVALRRASRVTTPMNPACSAA